MFRVLRVLRGDTEESVRLGSLWTPPKLEQLHFLFYILGPHVNISLKKSTHALKKKER